VVADATRAGSALANPVVRPGGGRERVAESKRPGDFARKMRATRRQRFCSREGKSARIKAVRTVVRTAFLLPATKWNGP
jgi:hypothetical protein